MEVFGYNVYFSTLNRDVLGTLFIPRAGDWNTQSIFEGIYWAMWWAYFGCAPLLLLFPS